MKLLAAYSYRKVSGSQTSAQVEFRNVRLGSSASSTPIEGKKYSYDSMGNITWNNINKISKNLKKCCKSSIGLSYIVEAFPQADAKA